MKKLVSLGKALSKAQQKSVNGGGPTEPCPCVTEYEIHGNGPECSYPAQGQFGGGLFRCLGTIQPNGTCCVNP